MGGLFAVAGALRCGPGASVPRASMGQGLLAGAGGSNGAKDGARGSPAEGSAARGWANAARSAVAANWAGAPSIRASSGSELPRWAGISLGGGVCAPIASGSGRGGLHSPPRAVGAATPPAPPPAARGHTACHGSEANPAAGPPAAAGGHAAETSGASWRSTEPPASAASGSLSPWRSSTCKTSHSVGAAGANVRRAFSESRFA